MENYFWLLEIEARVGTDKRVQVCTMVCRFARHLLNIEIQSILAIYKCNELKY